MNKESLLTAGMVSLLSFPSASLSHPAESDPSPNIIFIIADDLNNWIEGFDRHPQTITPRMSELIENGIKFTNAHANNPICGPSRASLMTGLHPHTTGYFGYRQQANNWREFDILSDAVTMIEHFYDHGYNVYGTGKIFHGGHEDWSVWRGDDTIGHFGAMPSFGPFAWDGQRGLTEDGEMQHDHIAGMPHPDVLRYEGERRHWGGSLGSYANIPEYPPNEETGAPGYKGWILYGEPWHYEDDDNRDLVPDELSVEYARKVLAQDHDKPFFLSVGFNRPHSPFHAPQKYFDMYPLEEIKLPNVKEGDLEDAASMLWNPCQTASCSGFWAFRRMILEHPGVPDMWERMVQAYLACVTFTDDMLGDIMDALHESAYAENTIVIFTSDHGFHLGEKEFRAKGTLWEESSNVPFIFWSSDLEHAGSAVHHPISLVDIYPTLVDFACLPDDQNRDGNGYPLDGYSIRPFIEDPHNGKWDGPDFAVISVASGEELDVNEPGIPERQFYSLRTEQYRYSLTPNGEQELYDHFVDPFEWTNLARVDGYEDMLTDFRRTLLEYVFNRN